ncbi:MAG: hypothetical protein ABIS66_03345, partial [Sphingomicrobium sp.]
MRDLAGAVTIAAALLLAACGSNGGDKTAAGAERAVTPATASWKACDILTEADAARALGHPVKKLAATGGAAGLDICQYGYQGEKLTDMGQASVTLH